MINLKINEPTRSQLLPGMFYLVRQHKGVSDYIIFVRMPLNLDRCRVDFDTDLNGSPEFQHHYIIDVDDKVVGSLIRSRTKFTMARDMFVSRVYETTAPTDMRCLSEEAGGVFIFGDSNGSYFALSAHAHYGAESNALIVTDADKGD